MRISRVVRGRGRPGIAVRMLLDSRDLCKYICVADYNANCVALPRRHALMTREARDETTCHPRRRRTLRDGLIQPADPRGRPLLVAVDTAFVPFEFKQGDKYVGFDIDLWDAVAKELKLDYKLQ